MSREKPEWMKPCVYNDDRFDEKPFVGRPNHMDRDDVRQDDLDERDPRDIEEILSRPDRREERDYECNDVSPINYKKGPHDDEFGVEDKEFDRPDDAPVPYGNGAHDDEFGVDDDAEPLDDEPEFDED